MACGSFDRTSIASALTKPIPFEHFHPSHLFRLASIYCHIVFGIDSHIWAFLQLWAFFGSFREYFQTSCIGLSKYILILGGGLIFTLIFLDISSHIISNSTSSLRSSLAFLVNKHFWKKLKKHPYWLLNSSVYTTDYRNRLYTVYKSETEISPIFFYHNSYE